jgi:hypothetical protein
MQAVFEVLLFQKTKDKNFAEKVRRWPRKEQIVAAKETE